MTHKHAIFIIVLAGLFPAMTFGQSTNADCSIVDSSVVDLNVFTTMDGQYASLLPEDAQKRVSKNLRAYCCEQNILKEVTCKKTKTDIPPD